MVAGSSNDTCWQDRRHALAVDTAGLTGNPKSLRRSSSFLTDVTFGQFWSVRAPQSYTALGDYMQKRAAIYVRVSTDKQTIENQVAAPRQIAERHCVINPAMAIPAPRLWRLRPVGWFL